MRTAEELKKKITEKRISELEDSLTEDVKLAWDTLEEIVISNDNINFIYLNTLFMVFSFKNLVLAP